MPHPRMITAIAATIALTGCAKPAPTPAADTKSTNDASICAIAHAAYVTAINTNTVDKLMAGLTDDIVYQSPNEPEIVGKAAVRAWAAAYIEASSTKWEKTALDCIVSGNWAFERYTYKVIDTNRKTGAVTTDHGKGINIYHHDPDGQWRVARDGWSSDGKSGG